MPLPGPQLRLPVQPLVAVRRFVSAAERQKFGDFFLRDHIQGVTRQRGVGGSHSSPFSGDPWLLAWGKVEGWVYISGFCQWSSFGFHQWMAAVKEWDRNKEVALLANTSYISLPFDACTAVKNAVMLLRDSLRCTHCSCQHVIHQSPETPPVHSSVMSTPHQDLRSPEVGERNGRLDTAETSQCKPSHMWPSANTEIRFHLQNVHDCVTYMYSIVPQKVWVTVPSWMDSLHRPKSVSFTCPGRKQSENRRLFSKTNNWLQIRLQGERSQSRTQGPYKEVTQL